MAFPKPVHLSKRIVAWRVEDIRALIEKLNTAA
jgi:predicted DNA-binding transcriptional regulator AlpA